MRFTDRRDAGRRLGQLLSRYQKLTPVVLALPRGGVPVASEVARALSAELDVLVVRKIGAPHEPEMALGAVGEGGVLVRNNDVLGRLAISNEQLAALEQRERSLLEAQLARYRLGRPPVEVDGRVTVVVDDGVATGSTARAACQVVRARGAKFVALAVPVAPRAALEELRRDADEVVYLEAPVSFFAVGEWYEDFQPTRDTEVLSLLGASDPGGDGEADAAP